MALTEEYFEESIDKAMMDHERMQSRIESLENDLGLIFSAKDAQMIATETINEINENPRALFEKKQSMIDRIEAKLNINLNTLIQREINIMAMHKPQTFENMTFNKNDLYIISNKVIKAIYKTSKNCKDEKYLKNKIDELKEDLNEVNKEIECMRKQIEYLKKSKIETAINCNHNMNEIRNYLLEYSKCTKDSCINEPKL